MEFLSDGVWVRINTGEKHFVLEVRVLMN